MNRGRAISTTWCSGAKWVRNALNKEELRKFDDTLAIFRKYAGKYDFDWLMVMAQAYPESGLDQK